MSNRATLGGDGRNKQTASPELEQLLAQPLDPRPSGDNHDPRWGVIVGTLIGFFEPCTPLITYPGQPGTAALAARATVDLSAEHVGQQVTVALENGDPKRPIVTGRIRESSAGTDAAQRPHVEFDATGYRLTVSARDQLVLRCGRASITLTKSGKVLIDGLYVSSRSSGVNRISGGSVQLN